MIIEPHVDASVMLRDKLLADEVDLMIVPEVVGGQRFLSRRVGVVDNAWMCKPGMAGKRRRQRMSWPRIACWRRRTARAPDSSTTAGCAPSRRRSP